MHTTSIYDTQGTEVNRLEIDDDLIHCGGRVWKGNKHYYKGLGIPYSHHQLLEKDITDDSEFDMIQNTNIFYLGYSVCRKSWKNKVGIFQERYQPFFPDFIGACSVKEKTITGNSRGFRRSSVDVMEVINYDAVNKQYYFKMDYKCKRKSYIQDDGKPQKLQDLLEYMLRSDWNFLWDKGAINDITPEGLVSDVADLFESDELHHQLGTVYSVLYSLYNVNVQKYFEFLKHMKLEHKSQSSFITNSILILENNGIDTLPLKPFDDDMKNFKHTVLNFLLQGKNCAYCSCDMFIHEGDLVRDDYVRRVSKQLQHIQY
mgnify:FL=1